MLEQPTSSSQCLTSLEIGNKEPCLRWKSERRHLDAATAAAALHQDERRVAPISGQAVLCKMVRRWCRVSCGVGLERSIPGCALMASPVRPAACAYVRTSPLRRYAALPLKMSLGATVDATSCSIQTVGQGFELVTFYVLLLASNSNSLRSADLQVFLQRPACLPLYFADAPK